MTTKTDLLKTNKNWYKAAAKAEIVHFDSANYLAIEGKGDPSGDEYALNLQALYSTAYALKFLYKSKNADFVVAKLEGQWWFDTEKFGKFSMEEAPVKIPRSEWNYRSLIRLPEYVSENDIVEIREKVKQKKQLEEISKVHFYQLPESYFVQILHVGPFANEPESLLKLKEFMDGKNFKQNGFHHEIYLSDFRKTAPEKLKTILREPVI